MIPHGVENRVEILRVDGGLDAGSADQAGERTRGIGTAGKAENMEFVPPRVILGDVPVGVLHDLLQTDADGATEQMLQQIRVAADAIVIEGDLLGAVRRPGPDQWRSGLRVVGIQLGNIGVVALALLVPGAVDQADYALHRDQLRAFTLKLNLSKNLDLINGIAISDLTVSRP